MTGNKCERVGERIWYAEKKNLAPWLKEKYGMSVLDLLDIAPNEIEFVDNVLDEFDGGAQ